MRNLKTWSLLGTLSIVVACYLPVFLCSRRTLAVLVMDDQAVEWTGTLACLIASVLFVIAYWKYSTGNDLGAIRTRRNVFLLLLGLMLFVAFGEEISWGQRILNVATPAAVSSENVQDELNIHNLKWFTHPRSSGLLWLTSVQTLFTLFWGAYGFLIPLLCAISSAFRSWASKVNLPIVPIYLGIGYVVNMFIWLGIASFLPAKGCIEEFAETASEILVMLIALSFLIDLRGRARTLERQDAAQPAG